MTLSAIKRAKSAYGEMSTLQWENVRVALAGQSSYAEMSLWGNVGHPISVTECTTDLERERDNHHSSL